MARTQFCRWNQREHLSATESVCIQLLFVLLLVIVTSLKKPAEKGKQYDDRQQGQCT